MHAATSATPPQASGVLIGVSANNDKRNKTIINCLRDRTPSHYSRSVSRDPVRYGSNNNADAGYRPEADAKESRARRINKLTSVQTSSTRDHKHLQAEVKGASSSSLSSSSISSASTAGSNMDHNGSGPLQQFECRFAQLEKELRDQRVHTQALESRVLELTRRVDELSALKQTSEKPKKSASRKPSAGASAIQPSKLVAWMKLSNLWKYRPSIETLKEQNIYNDEPCFDTEIELVLKHEIFKTVPKIVVDCCDLIEDKYRKSSEPIEGIYRQCGDYNKIQTLRFRIDANDYDALRQPKIDIHTLTGVLKLFLREIKSPLVRVNEAKTFIGKPNHWLLTEFPTKIEILKRLIRSLPEVNRDTMQYLFKHFNRLTKVPLQSVSAETLSVSVTPSIFHTVQQGVHMQDIHVLLKESEVLADCAKTMIEYHGRIFDSSDSTISTPSINI